jgi:hypothetical protein
MIVIAKIARQAVSAVHESSGGHRWFIGYEGQHPIHERFFRVGRRISTTAVAFLASVC